VARDLIYGEIARNWGIGDLVDLTSEATRRQQGEDILAHRDVGPLAKVVESETQAAFQLAARLSSAGKITTAERRALKPTLQKWFELRDRRQGRFLGEDYVELANLRDASRAYRRKLEEWSRRTAPAASQEVGPARGLGVPLAVAAGAAGLVLLIFSRK
jgi:hypothetical protein